MKNCKVCEIQITSQTAYYTDRKYKTLDNYCKVCRSQYSSERRKEKIERQEIEKAEEMKKESERIRDINTEKKRKNHQCYKCYWGRYIETEIKYVCMLPNCWGIKGENL